jgi:hypothetical protein
MEEYTIMVVQRLLRFSAVMASAGLALGLVAAPAGAAITPLAAVSTDSSPPVVVSSSVTPASVNPASGPASVTVSVHVTDASGVMPPKIEMYHPVVGQFLPSDAMVLASGTARDGIWKTTVTVPRGTPAGRYKIMWAQYGLQDVFGNFTETPEITQTVTVAPSGTDTEGPMLWSLSDASESELDVTAGPVPVKLTAHITDPAGTLAPTVSLDNFEANQFLQAPMTLIAGDITDGIWEGTINVPPGVVSGLWSLRLSALQDLLGNTSWLSESARDVMIIAGAADTDPPVLVSSSVTPNKVDVSTGPATIVARAHVTDTAGTETPGISLSNGEGQALYAGPMVLTSGDSRDGYWEQEITVPQGTMPGQWEATFELSQDVLNNVDFYTGPVTVPVTVTRSTPVTPAAVLFAGVDGKTTPMYAIPSTTGVDYLVAGKVLTAGKYAGAGTVTVTARARNGYVLAPGSKTTWSASFPAVLAGPVPTITGTRKVGYTLTTVPGTWGPAPVTLRYQWYRSGVAITGATAKAYLLSGLDAGKQISVRVTGSKTGHLPVTKASAATAAITPGSLVAPTPTISGTRRAGYILTANPGTWTTGTTLRYQWYRSGVAIAGATAKTYKLVTADRLDTIKVRVVGSKTGYTTVTRFSASTSRIP